VCASRLAVAAAAVSVIAEAFRDDPSTAFFCRCDCSHGSRLHSAAAQPPSPAKAFSCEAVWPVAMSISRQRRPDAPGCSVRPVTLTSTARLAQARHGSGLLHHDPCTADELVPASTTGHRDGEGCGICTQGMACTCSACPASSQPAKTWPPHRTLPTPLPWPPSTHAHAKSRR
jgi:hypothetical protein